MGEAATPGALIELDERRRASLGRVGRHTRYLAREDPDGTIVLTPAVVMTVADLEKLHPGAELALVVGADTAKRITESVDDPSRRVRRGRLVKTVDRQIIDVIRAAGLDGISAGDIVKKVKASRSAVFAELAKLRKDQSVKKSLSGKYVLNQMT